MLVFAPVILELYNLKINVVLPLIDGKIIFQKDGQSGKFSERVKKKSLKLKHKKKNGKKKQQLYFKKKQSIN